MVTVTPQFGKEVQGFIVNILCFSTCYVLRCQLFWLYTSVQYVSEANNSIQQIDLKDKL